MLEPAVIVQSLVVRRGGDVVLDDVSIDVPRGRVVGLLGPSGCGKTTLMRCLVGVQIVESGNVRVLGLPAGHTALRRRVGYVTQAPSVYPDLTVAENMGYFARIAGVVGGRVRETLARVGLEDERDRLVANLSGGQRARVSLAAALLNRPEVLVLDEPTVGQDPLLRRALWAQFHALADDGATLIVSSHVMDEAERCDSLVLMREGRVLATGTNDELSVRTGAATTEEVFVRLVGAAG